MFQYVSTFQCFASFGYWVLILFDFIPISQCLEVQKHQSSVLIGETGSGKTTQVSCHVEGRQKADENRRSHLNLNNVKLIILIFINVNHHLNV